MTTEHLAVTISGGREAPARARAALNALNSTLNGTLHGIRDDVRLLVTELVTNAVVHGGAGPDTPIDVRVVATSRGVRAQIEHAGPEFEARPRPQEHRYGLFLVEQIAHRWGVTPHHGRNRAWFEVCRRNAEPPY
jgi:anti-sigma regulatory factor (Ser/Thr protein kinase)